MVILIVDDDAAERAWVLRLFRKFVTGHTVLEAATGPEGLALMRSERPDLVFLDILLGHPMSGWEFAIEKSADQALRTIPLVVLSGLTPEEIRHGYRGLSEAMSGASLIISKPLEADMLRHALAALGS